MTVLRRLWASWKRFARRLGEAQARVLLSIFYFVILAPFALLFRFIRRDSSTRAWDAVKGDDTSASARAARQW